MKALKNRRALVVAGGIAAIVVVVGAIGAFTSKGTVGEARSQSKLMSASDSGRALAGRAGAAAGGGTGGVAFTVGGLAPQNAASAASAAPPAPSSVPSASSSVTSAAGPRIVKTGSVDVEVRKHEFGPAFNRVTAIATGLGGYVSSSKTFESSDIPNGNVVARVPSDKFDELVRQVRGLGKVRAVSSSGEDVTGQITDLRARLRANEAQRDQYLALLTKATSISDTLAIRDRLNQVQTEIEQLQGQLKLLDDQTSFGTLTVSLAEPGLAVVGPQSEKKGWAKAWDDAVGGFVRGSQAIVAHSGAVLLGLVCLAVVFAVGRPAWAWITRRLPAEVGQET